MSKFIQHDYPHNLLTPYIAHYINLMTDMRRYIQVKKYNETNYHEVRARMRHFIKGVILHPSLTRFNILRKRLRPRQYSQTNNDATLLIPSQEDREVKCMILNTG